MQKNVVVLIVGAGPTGLTMAVAALPRYGISFRIIDKAIKPVETSNALAVQARTIEVWNSMGILSKALAQGLILRHLIVYGKDKQEIAHIDTSLLNSENKFLLSLAQHDTESILIDYLNSKNIKIEMQTELTDVLEIENGTQVTLKHKNQVETIHVPWLIACDGFHSTIRKKLKIPFKGHDLPQHLILADAEIKSALQYDRFYGFPSENGLMLLAPYQKQRKKYWRIILDVTHNKEFANVKKPSYESIKILVEKRCPFALDIAQPIWTSGFFIHERMIANFRHKRIFFAGDSAHVHSPAGGQGMNVGIQDAYNLGWKLALVLLENVNPAILNTYNDERMPIAKKVLSNTTKLTRIVTIHNPILIKLRNWMISLLMRSNRIKKKIINTFGETNIQYTNSALTKDFLSNQSGVAAGMNILDVELNGFHLLDKLSGSSFILIIFMGMKETVTMDKINEITQYFDATYHNLFKFLLIRIQNELKIGRMNQFMMKLKKYISNIMQYILVCIWLDLTNILDFAEAWTIFNN